MGRRAPVPTLPTAALVAMPIEFMEMVGHDLAEMRKLLASRPATPAQPQGAEWITRKEAARLTAYSIKTITRLIDRGELPVYGPNRDRIRREDLDRVMAAASRPSAESKPSGDDEQDEIERSVERAIKTIKG